MSKINSSSKSETFANIQRRSCSKQLLNKLNISDKSGRNLKEDLEEDLVEMLVEMSEKM